MVNLSSNISPLGNYISTTTSQNSSDSLSDFSIVQIQNKIKDKTLTISATISVLEKASQQGNIEADKLLSNIYLGSYGAGHKDIQKAITSLEKIDDGEALGIHIPYF